MRRRIWSMLCRLACFLCRVWWENVHSKFTRLLQFRHTLDSHKFAIHAAKRSDISLKGLPKRNPIYAAAAHTQFLTFRLEQSSPTLSAIVLLYSCAMSDTVGNARVCTLQQTQNLAFFFSINSSRMLFPKHYSIHRQKNQLWIDASAQLVVSCLISCLSTKWRENIFAYQNGGVIRYCQSLWNLFRKPKNICVENGQKYIRSCQQQGNHSAIATNCGWFNSKMMFQLQMSLLRISLSISR